MTPTAEGIYAHNEMLGSLIKVGEIVAFMSTQPSGVLYIEQLPLTDVPKPKLIGTTWKEVITPPLRDSFVLAHWRDFVEETVKYTYDDLRDEYSDELTLDDIYGEDDNEGNLPWNAEVRLSARRTIIRYLLDSEWGKSREGQEKGIGWCRITPSHVTVKGCYKLLYQTDEVTDPARHRRAYFVAAATQVIMTSLDDYRRQQRRSNGKVRSRRVARWGGTL